MELEIITPSDDESVKLLANVPSWVEKSQLSLRVLEDQVLDHNFDNIALGS